MDRLYEFLLELDKLKSVHRSTYISDSTRHENSAEHSWHAAIAILALKDHFCMDIDWTKTVKMALVHDICEIGPGDISIYDPDRSKKEAEERAYLRELGSFSFSFVKEIRALWEEYEAQDTKESRWVKIADRLLPFMLNISTEGRAWKDQGIRKNSVIKINEVVRQEAPEIYEWMLAKIDMAVKKGWLMDY